MILLLVAVALWLAAALALYAGQRSMVFPAPDVAQTPEEAGLSGIAAATVAAEDGTALEVWRSAVAEGQPLALMFHGNGEINAFAADKIERARRAGYAVAAMEYRGYNGNPGSPSEAALVADAEAVFAALGREGIAADRIVLWGYSLGTGIAVQLAARHPVRGVVLEAPFTALLDVAAERFPYFPVAWFLRDPFVSRDVAGKIGAPTLVLSGSADGLIAPAQGQRLSRMIPGARFLEIEGAGHNDLGRHREETEAIEAFLAMLAP